MRFRTFDLLLNSQNMTATSTSPITTKIIPHSTVWILVPETGNDSPVPCLDGYIARYPDRHFYYNPKPVSYPDTQMTHSTVHVFWRSIPAQFSPFLSQARLLQYMPHLCLGQTPPVYQVYLLQNGNMLYGAGSRNPTLLVNVSSASA